MDYLIKKSNGTAESLGGTVDRVKLPTQTGGDVVFVGDKRPVDLGEYVLVKATEIDEPVGAGQKRGADVVVVSGETVTVTRTAIAMTAQEIWDRDIAVTDRAMPRWLEDHIESAHSGVAGNPFQQAEYAAKKQVRGRKP